MLLQIKHKQGIYGPVIQPKRIFYIKKKNKKKDKHFSISFSKK